MTNSSSASLRRKKAKASETPKPPEGWTRCHFYLEKKHRFCRQLPSQSSSASNNSGSPRYCGNHLYLLKDNNSSSETTRKRIPCPVDPTHWIFQDTLDKHIPICPKAKRQKMQQKESFYSYNRNAGGYGSIKQERTASGNNKSLEWAQRVALRVLQVHQQVFIGACKQQQQEDATKLTLEDIQTALPLQDLSTAEFQAGLSECVEDFRIRSGGPQHLHQQASLVGHLRRIGSLPPMIRTESEEPLQERTRPLVLLEVGAGRGMTGLVAASVAALNGPTRLIMVERDASRSKADTILRKCHHCQPRISNYMNPKSLEFTRIKCDLQHVDMQSVLAESSGSNTEKPVVVVLAKHLCGAGTDLALKALEPIQEQVSACVLATCCHGLCDWEHYVGRDFLAEIMKGEHDDDSFGVAEFELLRKWSAGTVRDVSTKVCANGKAEEEPSHSDVAVKDSSGKDESNNITKIVDSLKLACGANGLGRACQRLIDYGRREYLRKVLLQKPVDSDDVELLYYVPAEVTPQNAALVGRQ